MMTTHEAGRVAVIVRLHNHTMEHDAEHRLLCAAEPCSISLLLTLLSKQLSTLDGVARIAEAIHAGADEMRSNLRRRSPRFEHKAVETLDGIATSIADIIRSA